MGESHTQAWYGFINSKGFLNFDPSRHSRDLLQEFMTCATDGSFGIEPTGPFSNWSMYAKGGGKGKTGPFDSKGMCKGMFKGGNTPIMPPIMAAAMQEVLNRCFGSCWKGGKGGGNFGGFGGGSGGITLPPNTRPGDWVCLDCKNVNFSYRTVCNSCGGANRDQARINTKPGDWVCPNCGDLVFASKSACKMCQTPRPDGQIRVGSKPGDWTCPTCGDLVFASRNSCKMCQTEKPDGLGSAGAAVVNALEDASASGYESCGNSSSRPNSRYTPY